MTVWLGPDQVAERLGVKRRTAMAMMSQMPHSVISGTERKRVRVSEDTLEAWMAKRSNNITPISIKTVGSKKKLARR